MKKLVRATLLTAALSAISGVAYCDNANTSADANKNNEFLYVQMSAQGTLTATDSQGKYQLTLTNTSPYTKYFANHPARSTGIVPTEKFMASWQQTYAQNPPNASLYGIEGAKAVDVMLKLTDPIFDEKSGTITYTAETLKTENLSQKVQLKDVAVFIDGGFCASCVGGF